MDDPKLTIELVPESCHFSNLRSNLPKKCWDQIRKECYKRFDHKCSVCGGQGRRHPVEAHETWVYDDSELIQKLVDVVALCPDCHKVKHMGLSIMKGWEDRARKHLARVNGWSLPEALRYEEDCFIEWQRRSLFHWTLDISWLEDNGYHVPKILDRIDWNKFHGSSGSNT